LRWRRRGRGRKEEEEEEEEEEEKEEEVQAWVGSFWSSEGQTTKGAYSLDVSNSPSLPPLFLSSSSPPPTPSHPPILPPT